MQRESGPPRDADGDTLMSEKPILFSGPMIRALLDGKKTQTRRVVMPQPELFKSHGATCMRWKDKINTPLVIAPDCLARFSPYGGVGDRLWVRETWMVYGEFKNGTGYAYRADGDRSGKWRPSIFMPRAASRITLEIDSVKVERVQYIGVADAIAEGINSTDLTWFEKSLERTVYHAGTYPTPDIRDTPQAAYACLWDTINSKRGYGWDTNPWVWVVQFHVVTK